MNAKYDNFCKWLLDHFNKGNYEEVYNTLNNLENSLKDELYNDIKKYAFEHIKPKEINTIEDLANLLNGNSYGNELENDIELNVQKIAKDKNWLIVFPYSDDLLEFRGVVDDELDAYDGTIAKYVKKGDYYLEDSDEYGDPDARYLRAKFDTFVNINETEKKEAMIGGCLYVESIWEPEGKDLVWDTETNARKYATFNIIDSDEQKTWANCLIIDMNYQ